MKQKWQMTNALGVFRLMKLKVGIWKIKFSAPGYQDLTITVRVDAKEVLKPEILMKKI